MSDDKFRTFEVNGIEIQTWHKDKPGGRQEARELAHQLPEGGDFGNGYVRRIDSPIDEGGEMSLWLRGDDGHGRLHVPDGYEVNAVSVFDSPGVAVKIQRTN